MKFYLSDGALLLLVVVYAPIVVLALWWLWRKLPQRRSIRFAITTVVALAASAVPLWDVAITSVQMARLCPGAGLKVYRTVEADGYLANFGYGEEVLKAGFSYFEKKVHPGKISVYERRNGKISEQSINPKTTTYTPKSRYEYQYDSGSALKGALHIAVRRSMTKDRTSGELLGEELTYTAFPGWVDRHTVQLLGNFVWPCPQNSKFHVGLVDQTIRPTAR